jgi:hypothetical protein
MNESKNNTAYYPEINTVCKKLYGMKIEAGIGQSV